ncbi:hypothetical protein ACL02S_14310 [Nocardia sp. 004]
MPIPSTRNTPAMITGSADESCLPMHSPYLLVLLHVTSPVLSAMNKHS